MNALVEYRVRWRPGGVLPGAFRGTVAGSGNELRAVVPLADYPDPRRLDLRTTLRDPFQRLWVRDFKQTTALKLFVLADVSASMAFRGRHDKFALLRRIISVLAHSAWKGGDRFGVYAADEHLRPELCLPARVNRGAGDWLDPRYAAFTPTGRSAQGLFEALAELPSSRALLFLISDFHWPEQQLREMLRRVTHHDLVPIVLWDPAETEQLPRHGFARLRDSETGERRFVWLRPALAQELRAARARQRAGIEATCRAAGRRPFFVTDAFDPHQLTRHFMEAL